MKTTSDTFYAGVTASIISGFIVALIFSISSIFLAINVETTFFNSVFAHCLMVLLFSYISCVIIMVIGIPIFLLLIKFNLKKWGVWLAISVALGGCCCYILGDIYLNSPIYAIASVLSCIIFRLVLIFPEITIYFRKKYLYIMELNFYMLIIFGFGFIFTGAGSI